MQAERRRWSALKTTGDSSLAKSRKNPEDSTGSGLRTEHQVGEGSTYIDTENYTKTPCCALLAMIATCYMMIRKLAGFCSSQPSGCSWDSPFF